MPESRLRKGFYAQKKLNARLLDSMNEVCSMSDVIIAELREAIVGSIASLYKVSLLVLPPSVVPYSSAL